MQRNLKDDIISTSESFSTNFADKGNFDFSVESLQAVDDILEELSDFEMDEEMLDSVSSMAGCYIFEVARRNFGGEYFWIEKKEQPVLITGEPDFSISLYAFDKVKGRIENGKEDHIPFYFDGFISAVEKGRRSSGYCATIV
ncbi:hypothetical protein DFP94_1011471 [Fontibacillus phaseoli]|uniref:Uncharacterized protein n=1 Tax=Fontibacillus phaseoli TaxID=1416533 RepID=A0A369BTY0_9BACL|nr:hypothetical protein [Fontibacillus phaseoli]RCX23867.1 hypothetical protein DFP94_1011471 [Fontibacillus phaseoli]